MYGPVNGIPFILTANSQGFLYINTPRRHLSWSMARTRAAVVDKLKNVGFWQDHRSWVGNISSDVDSLVQLLFKCLKYMYLL